ncbi:type II secretion system F family protein [Saccharolobus solfataricus]|uniref:Type II secretion system F family protein n=2 Tax=Saccharolobus solfataricus TaxID=2287 RepID=A0A0E3MER6_SACSO|nr:type II secretion system F family protein [Saccharolobus solfataricus]AKA75007.1 type II secretion system F family protein [Saccharolobus solfataricus]AKA77699.1 type II secretion system F family protein [Saccharolobus solfataricus]AKA80390.1 type II secretion system F family protein [Saccharolobus solfataricus]AZF69465.1 type II secretion system F family protein [Saccharolobus solfataricus]AZF72085.1 type II secretion system F family protein [Saccharolobus solfataricus]
MTERRVKLASIISYDFLFLVLLSGLLNLIITIFRERLLYVLSSFFQYIVSNPSVALGDALGFIFVLQALLLGLFIGGIVILSISFTINLTRIRSEYEEGVPLSTILRSRIITSSRLGIIANWISERSKRYINASADLESPTEVGVRYVAYFLVSLLVVIPVSLALSIALLSPLPFLLIFFPLTFIFYPEQKYKSRAREIRDDIQDEIPFFVTLITIINASGTTIYEGMRKILQFPIFKAMKKEALLIIRDIEFFGKSPLDALEHRSRLTLNRDYSWFLAGYSSIIRSGGDIEAYLFQKAREFLNWLQFRWRFYSERTSFLGELIVILFLIFPMFLIALAFFTSGAVISFLLIIPILFGTILYTITANNRPRYMDSIGLTKLQLLIGFIAALLTAGVIEIFLDEIYYAIGLGLLSFSLASTIFMYNQIREINDVENSLPQFLRDITEFRKIGYDLSRAIKTLAEEKRYRREFNRVLNEITKQDSMGIPITRAKINTRSWLGKFSLTTVQILIESGAVRPDLLEYLTEFTLNFIQSKKEAFSRMRAYQVLGILTPLLLIATILIAIVIIDSFTIVTLPTNTVGLPQFPNIISQFILSPVILAEMFIFILMSTFAIGLLVTKALYGTVQYMIMPAIGLTLAVLSIHFFSVIEPIILKFFSI